jgi:hypothetical protein
MAQATDRDFWRSRVEDMNRHLADLEHDSYDEAKTRPERDRVFLRAFELVTPVAVSVLADMNEWLLDGRGTVATHPPVADGAGGLNGSWTLTWPRLEAATNVHNGEPLPPVTIDAVYPGHWTHGHLARLHVGLPAEVTAWPMQVLTEEDAVRQEPILRAIAEAEIHERVYQAHGDWEMVKKP